MKGKTTMKYSQPELNVLGEAGKVIQGSGKIAPEQTDPVTGLLDFVPAYDLDE